MLMKAFNRGFFFDDDRRTFRGKQIWLRKHSPNYQTSTYIMKLQQNEFFLGKKKRQISNFHDLTKVGIVYILKRKKMLQKIYLNNYIVSICSNSRRISTLETRNVGYVEVFKIYIYKKISKTTDDTKLLYLIPLLC